MTSIRRGQLISTYGIGSMVTDRENETFMLLSTDSWMYKNRAKYIVNEPHLLSYLGVRELVQPPAAIKLAFSQVIEEFATTIRFPSWYFCRKCKSLQQFSFEERIGNCINQECNGKWGDLIPTRFLSVCENGHIEDFPFQEWVHTGQKSEAHELEYAESSKISGLAGIYIKCKTCGKKRSMRGALSPDSLKTIKSCTGYRPWLYNGNERDLTQFCDKPLQGVQKAASNVYFPVIRNSIFIPDQNDLPENIASFLNNTHYVQAAKQIISNRQTCIKIIESLGSLNSEEAGLLFSILQDVEHQQLNYSDIKEIEYNAFRRGSVVSNSEFNCTRIIIDQYESWFKEYFTGVSLVEKLRDTRALVGFTRVKPYNEVGKSIRVLISQIVPSLKELPVDVVRGEGIFLEFNSEKIEKWKKFRGVTERFKRLSAHRQVAIKEEFADPEVFILLHTFAHILINELCLISGYNSASLRERIYSTSINGHKMNGVLIYTNSGDSEGSLGGLVRNGKPGQIEPLVLSALQKADWCSSDPVCGEVIPQGYEGGNLAACHNCCLLPETSCEFMNLSLDRGLLRGSMSDGTFGFFNEMNI
jgi:hypothetical protein